MNAVTAAAAAPLNIYPQVKCVLIIPPLAYVQNWEIVSHVNNCLSTNRYGVDLPW